MSKTIAVQSPAHFNEIVSSSDVVVIDFFADWCGPCKVIAPLYEQLSSQLSRPNKITFTRVDVDSQKQIAQTFNISAMPTFVILKSGRESKRITGADPKSLQSAVQGLAREAESVDASGSGATSASTPGSGWLGKPIPRGYSDVSEQVDVRGLDLLNRDDGFGTARALFENSQPGGLGNTSNNSKNKDWVESDTDEQMLLFVPFNSTLKIHSILLTSLAPADSSGSMRPKTVKIYQNTAHNLGFDEAESTTATQEISLRAEDWDEHTKTAGLDLRYVKFQKCSSLVIFIADGEGSGEKTRIDRIRFIGETGEKKAMGKLEKVGEDS